MEENGDVVQEKLKISVSHQVDKSGLLEETKNVVIMASTDLNLT